VLADFRAWLQQAAAASADNGATDLPAEPAEPLDLHTLLGQLVALRHEVNLQTRATRAQQEQTGEALRQLGQAHEALRQKQAVSSEPGPRDQEDAARPLLKALVDLHDSLALAHREVQRVQGALLPLLSSLTAPAALPVTPAEQPLEVAVRLPFWARLLGADRALRRVLAKRQALADTRAEESRQQAQGAQERRQALAEQAGVRVRQLVTSMVTGYTMSVQRLERALEQHGLEPIACVGEPFDPDVMEAVEVVTESGRDSTSVVEEVRRGYLWRGRLFRPSQVKVARPQR
jgi:molecular chaperone GrpE